MSTTRGEQQKNDHAMMLAAAKLIEERRTRARRSIPAPGPVQGRPMPTLNTYLDLLAFLGDSSPAPIDLLEAMERFDALKQARRARPSARPAPEPQGRRTARNATARPVLPQGLAATSTQGLETLIRAWQEASLPTRQAFRQWVNDQSLTGVARVSTSAQTQRYAAEIARICSVDAASVS